MHFPVVIPLGPWRLPAHMLFELLAYSGGFQLYRFQRRRAGDALDGPTRWSVVAAAIAGAALGAKVLCWFVDPALLVANLHNAQFWLGGGKTIVGGLAGGLLGVELAKKRLGITRATGDLYALPLALGVAVGRLGCFFTGLSDRTYGLPTTLPWGVDFGDGIPRHPTQLYESGLGLALAAWLLVRGKRPHAEGALFREFMVGYMGFRLAVEFIKPGVAIALSLSAIQWVCLAVLAHYARLAWATRRAPGHARPALEEG